jgi:hypothetical protein
MRATMLIFGAVMLCAACDKGSSDGNAPTPSASELAPASSGGEKRHFERDGDGGAHERRERPDKDEKK